MIAYADTAFYADVYHGSLNGAELERSLRRANAYIGALMLRSPSPVPDEVKYAVCEIADMYNTEDSRSGIVSENNDGYSVTYDNSRAAENKAYDIAVLYLANTGLLSDRTFCSFHPSKIHGGFPIMRSNPPLSAKRSANSSSHCMK